ncbi:MAG: hypothetical protein A3F67_04255 [Verrucomicrobia bacterium RIFCSPHIGHO2_12_FULL_41_10]|nr:MAG: hypothetical protein A3F67_04255 [Verrucomicrobia bacterium RIFCSPHIGHO2_12_FULL_41_10]HLB34549.1 hypothetical protein [Chthoniobacterales bacterium]
MIKIHINQIPEGETLHLEGEMDPASLGLEEGGAQPLGLLSYTLDVGLSAGGLFATGTLAQKMKMTCVSCLQPFEYCLMVENFALQKELDGCELVDLTFEVREDIHLLLPMHPRCDLGGDKKCPVQFPQRVASSQEVSEARPVWAALDHIKL